MEEISEHNRQLEGVVLAKRDTKKKSIKLRDRSVSSSSEELNGKQIDRPLIATKSQMKYNSEQQTKEGIDIEDIQRIKQSEKVTLRNDPDLAPLDVYRPKVQVNHDWVNYGLNMCFKKLHKFSFDPEQGGGPLAPNQLASS